MKKYPLGKTEQELASELGGLMVDPSCNAENFRKIKSMYGGQNAKCMMNNIKGHGANTMRGFTLVDGVVKSGTYHFVDTTSNQQNFKKAWRKLDDLVDGTKANYIKEIKQNNTKYNKYYFAVWDWGKGFFTANIMCTMINIGNKWEFPKNIRGCYAFKAQFFTATEQNKVTDDMKVNHADF
ncbi:MAG: hypothetical protein AB7I27_19170 [Bacteriovoracaceae bacterium]